MKKGYNYKSKIYLKITINKKIILNLVGNMTEVTAGIEYKINIDGKGYLLDERKFNLLKNIKNTGSITKAAKLTKIRCMIVLKFIFR